MKLNDYAYDEIRKESTFEFKRVLSLQDVGNYARLTGDLNPLHCDDNYAKSSPFGKRVVHGMLAASLFSTLVGMVCPGKRNLYLAQTLNFKNPIYPDSELIVRGLIKNKIDSIKVIIINTEIICKGVVMVNGEAKVKVID